MITEQQLDEMARKVVPGKTQMDEDVRGIWKDTFRRDYPEQFEPDEQPTAPAWTPNTSIPADRLQNAQELQERMMKAGFDKMRAEVYPKEDGSGIRLNVDISKAIEHFQHVHALIANTATQQAYREAIAAIEPALSLVNTIAPSFPGHTAPHDASMTLHNYLMHLHHCIAELDAQFADLEQKIFGTDKPKSNEQTPQAGTV